MFATADSTFLEESRAMRERAASNPFSSPSSSPSKRVPAKFAHQPRNMISAAASFRTPQHSDPIAVSSIISQAEVYSPSSLEAAGITRLTAENQRAIPTFVCKTVYDVKPVPGAGFWGTVEWDEFRKEAVEVYAEKMEEGDAAKSEAQDGWDVEPEMQESDGESEEERTPKKRKVVVKEKKVERKPVKRMQVDDSEESSDEDEQDGETFVRFLSLHHSDFR